jgi:hypothetical protein
VGFPPSRTHPRSLDFSQLARFADCFLACRRKVAPRAASVRIAHDRNCHVVSFVAFDYFIKAACLSITGEKGKHSGTSDRTG